MRALGNEVRMACADKEGGSTGPGKPGRERESDVIPVKGRYSAGTFYKT